MSKKQWWISLRIKIKAISSMSSTGSFKPWNWKFMSITGSFMPYRHSFATQWKRDQNLNQINNHGWGWNNSGHPVDCFFHIDIWPEVIWWFPMWWILKIAIYLYRKQLFLQDIISSIDLNSRGLYSLDPPVTPHEHYTRICSSK